MTTKVLTAHVPLPFVEKVDQLAALPDDQADHGRDAMMVLVEECKLQRLAVEIVG